MKKKIAPHFKPKLVPTLITLPIILLLIGLGFWQLHRMAWKAEVISERRAMLYQAPVPVKNFSALSPEEMLYRPLQIYTRLRLPAPVPVMSVEKQGTGFFLYYPFILRDQAVFLRGEFIPGYQAPSFPGRTWDLRGIGVFVRSDHPRLEAAAHPRTHPYTLLYFGRSGADFMAARESLIQIPNNHLGYALVWFFLALVLGGIYFVSQHPPRLKLTGE